MLKIPRTLSPLVSLFITDANNHIDARRYFKQSEIVLFRQTPEVVPQLAIDQPSLGGKLPVQTPPVPA